MRWRGWFLAVALVLPLVVERDVEAAPIDRKALVTRHDPVLTQIDPHAPLMLGNGNLGFTADITGLQTLPERYSEFAPLLTMAQWAWHSFPNPKGFDEASALVLVPVPGRGDRPYAYIRDWSELERNPALPWLRENPHRFSLGRLSFVLRDADGRETGFVELGDCHQELDLWTGSLRSRFTVNGAEVQVETRVLPNRDEVLVDVRSSLLATGALAVKIRYPGVAQGLNPDPSDWSRPELHKTRVMSQGKDWVQLERRLDDTVYYSTIAARPGRVVQQGAHEFLVRTGTTHMTVAVTFERENHGAPRVDPKAGAREVADSWRRYWTEGGMIDFSGSSDPRASELERRVVLSQYLSAVNGAGELPPQEEGLFSNSWNGKFHLEMHPMHSAHFATWGREGHLERSLGWYLATLPTAMQVARRQGVEGAWWTKMSGPEGRNSPSTINPFIMWQQPHPVFMAELVWQARRDRATLDRYAELVEQTARLLGSWPRLDSSSGHYTLGPPIVPVQENHPPLSTSDPLFEVEYFRRGLQIAQQWRERRGLARDPHWDEVIANLAPPVIRDGLVQPMSSEPAFWDLARSPVCSRNAIEAQCLNRDHPSFLMPYGWFASDRLDRESVRRTLRATEQHWDFRQVWGWDFPLLAMTAARLGEPERAVDFLFADYPNNHWGQAGMTPRFHLETGGSAPRIQQDAETYFPSNGSMLLAVGMMAAGWEGSGGGAPGFPPTGWTLRVEGIHPLP